MYLYNVDSNSSGNQAISSSKLTNRNGDSCYLFPDKMSSFHFFLHAEFTKKKISILFLSVGFYTLFTRYLMTTKEIKERIIDIKMDAAEGLTSLFSSTFIPIQLKFFLHFVMTSCILSAGPYLVTQ